SGYFEQNAQKYMKHQLMNSSEKPGEAHSCRQPRFHHNCQKIEYRLTMNKFHENTTSLVILQ
ncbi:16329_t:CDS:1, partial [Funneliformis caledonium]